MPKKPKKDRTNSVIVDKQYLNEQLHIVYTDPNITDEYIAENIERASNYINYLVSGAILPIDKFNELSTSVQAHIKRAIGYYADYWITKNIFNEGESTSASTGSVNYSQTNQRAPDFIPEIVRQELELSGLYHRQGFLASQEDNSEAGTFNWQQQGDELFLFYGERKMISWQQAENLLKNHASDTEKVALTENSNEPFSDETNQKEWNLTAKAKIISNTNDIISNTDKIDEYTGNVTNNTIEITNNTNNIARNLTKITANEQKTNNLDSRGKVVFPPREDRDIATKKYVDDNSGGGGSTKLPFLVFIQENPTEQNLWTFLRDNNAGVGSLVLVNGRFYTIIVYDDRPSGMYYLWSPQRHIEDNKFETETFYLTCGNEGNPLNPTTHKNKVHGENVLIHDPYGAQGAHNDMPLNQLIRYWDGTIDDLANPNLWQSIIGWPAENENDYSGVYNVFTKHTWKLDRNRVNRVIYNYDENTNTDDITYKLPIKTTKTDNFADTELIPQSKVKELINAGGVQPWLIFWADDDDYLELKVGTGAFPNITFTDQGRVGIKNQVIRYGGENDRVKSFTISATAYIANPAEKHPNNAVLYLFTTPFALRWASRIKVLVHHPVVGDNDPNGEFFFNRLVKINRVPTSTGGQLTTFNSMGGLVSFGNMDRLVELDIIVHFSIYSTKNIN